MREAVKHGLIGLLCLVFCRGAWAEEIQEIFYAPFDGSPTAVIARGMSEPFQFRIDRYEPGVVGQAAVSERRYNGIRYDGRGNIDLDRGTWAFFYKPLYEPTTYSWLAPVSVSSDIEGYWGGVLQFLLTDTDQFQLRLYDAGRYTPRLSFRPIYKRWRKGEWHHLAVVWDRHEGITIYEDGARVASNWGSYRWDWNVSPRALVFGQWIYSTKPFAVDEARIYATPLTDAQIAQLAQGQEPSGSPIPITPPAERRAHDLARMGWAGDDLEQIPSLRPNGALRCVFARVLRASDAKRLVAQPFEGLWDSTWPLQKYGASCKGKLLELQFAENQTFDRVRIFAHRAFAGSFQELIAGLGLRQVLAVATSRPIWRGTFGSMRSDRKIFLKRERGWLGQIDFYRAETVTPATLPLRCLTYSGAVRLDRLPPTQAGRGCLSDTPARFDNPVRATRAPTEPWAAASPAFGGMQILTEPLTEATTMDGVVLELAVAGLTEPTPIRVTVKEPVFTQRNWLVADAVLIPDGPERQRYTLHLQGRPVLNQPGMEVGVLVTAANPATWHLGADGTTLSLCLVEPDTAKPLAVADQIEFAREAYAQLNEGHIWDNVKEEGYGRLYYPVKWLAHFAPDARPAMELMCRIRNWREEPLPWDEPRNNTGAPDWAFWQRQAYSDVLRIVHWIIDQRQVENGEFGGVWGDDTDMVEYWPGYVLAGDDDHKIRTALRLFWSNLYQEALVDGVSRTIRDNLHSYEEGMGCIANQLLVDYGDPIAIERVMRASSHYENKWMAPNADGTYRFLGNYLGVGGVWTEGDFGLDTYRNHLMLIPAAYLVWYNRHPGVAEFIRKWELVRDGVSVVTDAALRLNGDEEAARQWYTAKLEELLKQGRDFHRVNLLLDEVEVREEWREALLRLARYRDFLDDKLPNYAAYSASMTEAFWLAYKVSGDMNYLVRSYKQACRFINNQEWLYTEAQPSTDRIPLPDTTIIRARCGAFVTERGGHSSSWPRYGISYSAGAADVAALVTTNDHEHLEARLYCFARQAHRLQARVWRLKPGTYRMALHDDANNDGVPEAAYLERTAELDRGAFIELQLRPEQGSILRVTAVQTREQQYDLADPAVAARELFLEYGDHLNVTVHNVGVRPVENLLVRIIDGYSGKTVAEKRVDRIDPPLDLRPKTTVVGFQNINALTKDKVIVQLDPEHEHPDLNRHNNRAEYIY